MQEIQETKVWFLGREDPLEKEMATHSSKLSEKIPRMQGLGGLQSIVSQKVGHHWATEHTIYYYVRIKSATHSDEELHNCYNHWEGMWEEAENQSKDALSRAKMDWWHLEGFFTE